MPIRSVEVTTVDGIQLQVREMGDAQAPTILFVHGWSQSYLSWVYQLDESLAQEFRLVTFDLRGHGMSGRPADESAYTDPTIWSGDVRAIIEQLGLRDVLLVGWSHGGFVVCDYLQEHGDASLTGINFVGWGVKMGWTKELRAMLEPSAEPYFAGMMSEDLLTNIEATRGFLDISVGNRVSVREKQVMLGYNMAVPAWTRRATADHRPCDNSSLLRTLSVPVLVSHGAADPIVKPAAVQLIADNCSDCRVSLYQGAGHNPFLERPRRFNRELLGFARHCLARSDTR